VCGPRPVPCSRRSDLHVAAASGLIQIKDIRPALGLDILMAQMFPACAMPNPDWWEALWPQPERAVASLGIASGMRVVDLCCGDGLFTLPMARLAAEVVAIDLDSEMLKRVRARLDAAGISNCRVVEGDAYRVAELSFGAADMVVMANTFHVPDKARLCQAVAFAPEAGRPVRRGQLAPSPARGDDCTRRLN
jgi:SAM-dependent methyltransferase